MAPKKATFSPSADTVEVIAKVSAMLEALPPRERGYAASRISAMYAAKQPTKPAGAGPSTKRGPSKPDPDSLTTKWKATEEYAAWQAKLKELKLVPRPEQSADDVSALRGLQASAFRKKGELAAADAGPSS
jgi:hypothetical protein